jgi:hypothetical protein
MFKVILSHFGNTSRFFSVQNVVQYILDGTIQKVQTCVFYHMTYNSIVMTWKILETCICCYTEHDWRHRCEFNMKNCNQSDDHLLT